MDSMFQQLKKLYESELYANVIPIACIMESAYDRERTLLTAEQYFLMLMYNGNSLFQQQQYRRADLVYRSALQARKSLTKTKPATAFSNSYENSTEMFPDHEIRYKIAMCMEITKNHAEAVAMLQSITNKQRTTKVNMLLGKLSHMLGKDTNAISAYKMVLRDTPLNLEATKMLLMLGVTALEIDIIITESNLPAQCREWLNGWIETYTSMFRCRFSEATAKLDALQSTSKYAKNEVFNVLKGQCHYYNGDNDNALKYLVRAHANNYYMIDGLSSLAAIYAAKNQLDELEKLTMIVSPSEYMTEHWFVMAQFIFAQGKYEKVNYFAHRACVVNLKNIEAGLLKVKVFLELKRFKEAIIHLKHLLNYANYRFEVYELLVIAYIGTNRLREAQVIATEAVRTLGKNPRTYVLVARPLLTDPMMKSKAKVFLHKALDLNKNYLPAVLLLVDILREEDDTAGALKLLKRMIDVQPSTSLYTILGDICNSERDTAQALHYYTQAICLDPNNRKAVNQLMALNEISTNAKGGGSSLLEVISSARGTNELNGNSNFEMFESTQLTPPNEMLPSLEEEDEEINVW